jgi:hypothetical protein
VTVANTSPLSSQAGPKPGFELAEPVLFEDGYG